MIVTREPAAERRQRFDCGERRILRAEAQADGRECGGKIVVTRAVDDLGRRLTVDRVDPDQRGIPLGAPGGAARTADAVAVDELAALDLSGGDVDIVVGLLSGDDAQETRAAGDELDDAFGDLAVTVTVPGHRPARGRPPALAVAPRLRGGLVLGLGLGLALCDGLLGGLFLLAGAGPATAAPASPSATARLAGRLLCDRGTVGLDVAGFGRGLPAATLDDRVDQRCFAKTAITVDREFGGDLVEVGERAGLECVALKYGHVFPFC